MSVTVHPREFRFVRFDAEVVRRIADRLVADLGIDRPVHVDIDETTPLKGLKVELGDVITVRVQGGAFEDPRNPRVQSEVATTASLGRALLRARDRLGDGFADAPGEDELTLRQMVAWDSYCAGRLARLGIDVNQHHCRWEFRNRHGFTPEADTLFEQLWSADGLTWSTLAALIGR